MLFNTQLFLLLFLPPCVLGYYLLARRPSARAWWLIAASIVFYSYWDLRLTPLLLASIAVNWTLVRLAYPGRITWLPVAGVALNLAVLGVFKYADFFASTLALLGGPQAPGFGIVLPLGISFFTFQQISYLVDVRRGEAAPYGFRDYVLYVSFFPQLIAGPIVRHHEIIGQYARSPWREGLHERLAKGAVLLTLGLVKKLAFADEAAEIADPVFSAALASGSVATADAWLGLTAFSLQIYFDFSGYSDMAIGLALLFGLTLPINFNVPYSATSISDFWRRWHVTLSHFLRDYLYIPLGGNRFGYGRQMLALLLTMLLGGLWHGAAWTFVGWGGVHGMALIANHAWRRWRRPLPAPLGWLLTMAVVVLAWVLFRAPDFATAWSLYGALAGLTSGAAVSGLGSPLVLVLGGVVAVLGPSSQRFVFEALPARRAAGVAAGLALAVAVIAAGGLGSEEFIYFQF